MGLSKEYIREHIETALQYPWRGELSIGTMERFRDGLRDFQQWASGVISGPIPWIADHLATIMANLSIKSLDIDPAENYDWQKSDLEGFCYRIQALLPDGTLAGYYLGRTSTDTYAAFGYAIMEDEAAPQAVSTSMSPPLQTPGPKTGIEEPQNLHTFLMDMMCCIMCADAKINEKEIRTICRIIKELNIPWGRIEVERRLKEFFQRVRSKGLTCVVEEVISRVRASDCLGQGQLLLDCVDRVAHADGVVDRRETDVLQKLKNTLDTIAAEPEAFDIEAAVSSWAVVDHQRPPRPPTRKEAERGRDSSAGRSCERSLPEQSLLPIQRDVPSDIGRTLAQAMGRDDLPFQQVTSNTPSNVGRVLALAMGKTFVRSGFLELEGCQTKVHFYCTDGEYVGVVGPEIAEIYALGDHGKSNELIQRIKLT